MKRVLTLEPNTDQYSEVQVEDELNECFKMVLGFLNIFMKKHGKKLFTLADAPKIQDIILFTDKKEYDIEDDELAFTEPASLMSVSKFKVYVSQEGLDKFSSTTVHDMLMHEAIHMVVDGTLAGKVKIEDDDKAGHNNWFKYIAHGIEKIFKYDDLGAEGFINAK